MDSFKKQAYLLIFSNSANRTYFSLNQSQIRFLKICLAVINSYISLTVTIKFQLSNFRSEMSSKAESTSIILRASEIGYNFSPHGPHSVCPEGIPLPYSRTDPGQGQPSEAERELEVQAPIVRISAL